MDRRSLNWIRGLWLTLLGLGLALIAASLLGRASLSIPYPDPTPMTVENQRLDEIDCERKGWAGIALVLIGLVGFWIGRNGKKGE